MLERFKPLLEFIPGHLRSLSPARLFVLLGVLGTGLSLGIVMLLWHSGDTPQHTLYTQLTMQDAAAITAKLREMGVAYTVQGDGTTILVPASMVYDLRLRLATEGLPQGGGIGFEVFDQHSFGMTEFAQKLNYQRALQGELARSIGQLAAVQSARVHIVMPEKSLFIGQQGKTTASVVLQLIPGRRLGPEQTQGIVRLVSNSVEGLAPTDVTVVDSTGQILSQSDDPTSKQSQTELQLSHQHNLEQGLERRIQSMLERAVGEGKVMVRVSATLDLQHSERTEERFDGENPAIRSEQRNKEEGTGVGFYAVGVPGVRANADTTAQDQDASKTKSPSSRQSETINYELSKTISRVVAPSGELKHLSVAVLVDGTYQAGEKKGERTYVPRTAEELAKYREIVKGAMGYNETRGDRVEVANVPFEARLTPEEQMAQESGRLFMLTLVRYAAYVILALLAVLFLVRPLVQWLIRGPHDPVVTTELPRTVRELEADLEVAGMLPEGRGHDSEAIAALKLGQLEGQDLRTQIAEFIRSEPERAAEVLRVWLRG
jgi:flagellar M-ring protein FliF